MIMALDHGGEVIAESADWREVASEMLEVARLREDWHVVDLLVADPAVVLHLRELYDDSGTAAYRLYRKVHTRLHGTCDLCGDADTVTTLPSPRPLERWARGLDVCDGCRERAVLSV